MVIETRVAGWTVQGGTADFYIEWWEKYWARVQPYARPLDELFGERRDGWDELSKQGVQNKTRTHWPRKGRCNPHADCGVTSRVNHTRRRNLITAYSDDSGLSTCSLTETADAFESCRLLAFFVNCLCCLFDSYSLVVIYRATC
jgi:hypothetical protein